MDLELLKRQLTDTIDHPDSDKIDGRVNPANAETMIGIPRLSNIQYCIEQVIKNKVEGDIIETGVWRGGACIFMNAVLKEMNEVRNIYVADSFEGLPKPNKKYPADDNDPHHTLSHLKISLPEVKKNFEKYGLLTDNVKFIKGFFSESLKKVPFEKLSILRLDGDMYSSTWEVLTSLYDKLSIGGYLIIDDYYLPACKKAVDDFREKNNITEPIQIIDWTGIFWQKLKTNNMTIKEMYQQKCSTPSDINELLPYLLRYANECEHVTEMGVRSPTSTYALLTSSAKTIVSYDIETQPEVAECKALCKKEKRDWTFIEADVLKVEIDETDFLWIDTFHTFAQLSAELKLHSGKAKKYIGFHDTSTYGINGEQPYLKQGHSGMNDGNGLLAAINNFIEENPEWVLDLKTNRNNGLTVLKRN